jgi:predicted RNA binding protein YcfA (HicA-like mRNA interferase family)
VLSFRDVDRALTRLGFVAVRQKGGHVFYRHDDGQTTTVPHHGNRDIAPPLLRKIMDDIGVRADRSMEALRS